MAKLLALFALYFAQGLPFGVQATALPLLLRERGVSLQTIGFAGLLSAPWLAKAAWAPLVDRYGNRQFGRRKTWIAPAQLALACIALIAASTENVVALAVLVLLMNLCAATQDIAVDALAVRWLKYDQLGPGNAMQVVGYKLGILTGGGLLVWASAWIGERGLFSAMAALMFAVFVMTLFLHEPDDEPAAAREQASLREIGRHLREALKQRETLSLLLVLLTYKTGESMADAMWKPLLLDRGFSAPQIGLWAGTYGMICSLVGSALAGALTRRVALEKALMMIAVVRTFGVAGEWWLAALPVPSDAAVIAVTCLEHFAGGALTTIVFALMMRQTDPRIGATHYTLLASVEVLGKMPLHLLSGVVAEALGYGSLFALATLACVLFVGLVWASAHRLARPAT